MKVNINRLKWNLAWVITAIKAFLMQNWSLVKVLSRIFCLGGSRSWQKILSHAAARKIFLVLLGGPVACSPGKFWKYSVQDWLKSHFWTLVTFTDSLKSSSKKIFIWNSCKLSSVKLLGGKLRGLGGRASPPPPVDRTLLVALLVLGLWRHKISLGRRERVVRFGYLPSENGFNFKKRVFMSRIVLLDPKLTPPPCQFQQFPSGGRFFIL